MDIFRSMQVFVEVANQGSFSRAARQLSISSTAASRYVIELETWLNIQLLQRTTRRVSLTDAGEDQLLRCKQILQSIEELRTESRAAHLNPQGEIRLTATTFLGKHFLCHVLPEFLRTYPRLKVRVDLRDEFVDLVEERYDIAIRIGELPDSTLIQRRIGNMRLFLTASPSYIARCGSPDFPEELVNHNCLIDLLPKFDNRWPLERTTGSMGIKVSGNFAVNDGEMIRLMTLKGAGISLLPEFLIEGDLQNGALVQILPNTPINYNAGIFVTYPQSRYRTLGVRVLIDSLINKKESLTKLLGDTGKVEPEVF